MPTKPVRVVDWWNSNGRLKYKVEMEDGTKRDTFKLPELPPEKFPDWEHLETALTAERDAEAQ